MNVLQDPGFAPLPPRSACYSRESSLLLCLLYTYHCTTGCWLLRCFLASDQLLTTPPPPAPKHTLPLYPIPCQHTSVTGRFTNAVNNFVKTLLRASPNRLCLQLATGMMSATCYCCSCSPKTCTPPPLFTANIQALASLKQHAPSLHCSSTDSASAVALLCRMFESL